VAKKAGGILAGQTRSNHKRQIDTSKVNPKQSAYVWLRFDLARWRKRPNGTGSRHRSCRRMHDSPLSDWFGRLRRSLRVED
jgi:hypothetical protein